MWVKAYRARLLGVRALPRPCGVSCPMAAKSFRSVEYPTAILKCNAVKLNVENSLGTIPAKNLFYLYTLSPIY